MSPDREHSSEPMEQEREVPVEDLKQKVVDAAEAEDVKGGGDITISKQNDSASANIFRN
jgi:hypothetical protein